jgi:hypothetical protein
MRRIVAARWPASLQPPSIDFTACPAGHPIFTFDLPNSVFGSDHTASDPFADLTSLAVVAGCEIYLKPDGNLAVMPYVDPDTAVPVGTFTDGENVELIAPLPLEQLDRDQDVGTTYNGVIVTGGSSTDPTCRAEWWDTNPASPTYVGTYGEFPAFYDTPAIRHKAQAEHVARALGAKLRTSGEVITLAAIPNGAYEGSDAFALVAPEVMDDGVILLEKLTLDCGEDGKAMGLTSRLTNSTEGVKLS